MEKMGKSAADHSAETDEQVALACSVLGGGGVVGYPSETVWGLGVLPHFAATLATRKSREAHKPFQVSCADVEGALAFAPPTPALLTLLAELPGPLTVVTPARPQVDAQVAPGGWVGLRVPAHPLAQKLLRRSGPLLTSSLNPAGQAPAHTFAQAQAYALADVLLGSEAEQAGGLASTVVQLPADMNGRAQVLRIGAFGVDRLRDLLEPHSLEVICP